MTRSRINTEQRLIEAVGSILLEQGYPAVGINAIARRAGCDKVLIYRYFGGFDELLLAFAETTTLWWEVDEIITESAADCAAITLPDYLQLCSIATSRPWNRVHWRWKSWPGKCPNRTT